MTLTAAAHDALKKAGLTADQAVALYDGLWEVIGRELAVGEEVEVPNLGTFFTTKTPARHEGEELRLPSIEPDFEPEPSLVQKVALAVSKNPELFATSHDDEEDEEDEGAAAPVSATPEEKNADRKERPLGRASSIKFLDLSRVTVDKDVLALVPQDIAKRYNAAPVDLKEGVLTVAMINPDDFDALQVLRKETGLTIEPVLTSRDDLGTVLDQYTGLQAEVQEVIAAADFGISDEELKAASTEKVKEDDDDENAPTAKIVGSLLKRAVKERASDIHIEPYEHKVVVRFRIDGVLMPRVELPKPIQNAVVARLKILANLKIDEQRLPQDGRFSLSMDKQEVDFRVSTVPVVFGEKVVMRILDKRMGIRDLTEVGLDGNGLRSLSKNMERSHGMILVTGPTGSGKTTTLYAVLGRLMKPDVNIITLEDPVEYRIESINQSQVHPEIGYSFATGLRAVVRQDPDIVMLGEVRDRETAEMAIQAALTGHVVLSTLHTNDAAGAFPRLIDMGVEPFLITSSVHTVIAQRLARKLDQDRKQERALEGEELAEVVAALETLPKDLKEELEKEGIDLKHPKVFDPIATDGHTGYSGRIGIFEVLDVSEKVRSLILERGSGDKIREQAVAENMLTMVQDGIVKALRGITSLQEVWRVTKE